MSNKKSKKFDYWLLFIWNVPAFFLSLLIGFNYLISATLFFIVPAVYLAIKKPEAIKKTALASVIILMPFTIMLDYLGHKDGSWLNFSITGIRIMGSFPIEDFVWAFVIIFYTIQFYEYFFDTDKKKTVIPKKLYIFNAIAAIITVCFIVLIVFTDGNIIIPYFYAFAVLIFMIIFPALIISENKKIFNGIIMTTIFFMFLWIPYEYIANALHQWEFPGKHFVGYVTLFDVIFPFEELMWIILCAPATLAYYELFADDLK